MYSNMGFQDVKDIMIYTNLERALRIKFSGGTRRNSRDHFGNINAKKVCILMKTIRRKEKGERRT